MSRNKVKTLLLNGKTCERRPEETVPDALGRQKASVPYIRVKQIRLNCMRQSLNCTPPIKSRRNLEETWQRERA
jgi:hypothetical protein